MNWQQLLSTQRYKSVEGTIQPIPDPPAGAAASALRTDFHVDYDRVVFSTAFRRLARKTQVHPFARHDHTHNRLTHSVEVASVGRSLGNQVGAMLAEGGFLPAKYQPADVGMVVQVACLAHDFGNPPFGHTGEAALRAWFCQPEHQHYLEPLTLAERNDIRTYEGNAHSLRLVSNLEMYQHNGGMRLTAAAIGTLLKYPWISSVAGLARKFSIYQTELPFITQVATELGLPLLAADHWARHPLSYLMEAADDICYALLDLEDGVELNLLAYEEVEKVLSSLTDSAQAWLAPSVQQRCAILRGMAIGRAVDDIAQTFMKHHDALLAGDFQARDLLAVAGTAVQDALNQAKQLAQDRIFRHQSKLITEIATFPCLGSILGLLVPAVQARVTTGSVDKRQELALMLLNEEHQVSQHDSLYLAYMKVLDFVGEMTDNTAARLAREISGFEMPV